MSAAALARRLPRSRKSFNESFTVYQLNLSLMLQRFTAPSILPPPVPLVRTYIPAPRQVFRKTGDVRGAKGIDWNHACIQSALPFPPPNSKKVHKWLSEASFSSRSLSESLVARGGVEADSSSHILQTFPPPLLSADDASRVCILKVLLQTHPLPQAAAHHFHIPLIL